MFDNNRKTYQNTVYTLRAGALAIRDIALFGRYVVYAKNVTPKPYLLDNEKNIFFKKRIFLILRQVVYCPLRVIEKTYIRLIYGKH